MSIDPRLFDDLAARGLVQDTTDRAGLQARLAEGPITVYCGFDPTAASLHVGNLIGLLTLRRFQNAGHRALSLAGGATGMIGDPSGKSAERSLLDDAALEANLAGIMPTLRQFLDFEGANPATLVDNRTWTSPVTMLEFLRDVGKHVTINQMVAKESVKARMAGEEGISYTEFSYMLLQANDFLWLYEHEGCEMQVGGSDQWGNIALGVDLIRRKTGGKAQALTWPLLLKPDGTKYGKTAGGETMWLNAAHLSPYRFYQGWMQVEDSEVRRLLLQLTFLEVADVDIAVAAHAGEPHKRSAQRLLAEELTALVHGPAAARSAREASEVVFGGPPDELDDATLETLAAEVPTSRHSRAVLDEPGNLVPVLVAAGVASSRSEAGRLIGQNGISVNGQRVEAGTDLHRAALLHDRWCLVRRGRKAMYLLRFDDGSES